MLCSKILLKDDDSRQFLSPQESETKAHFLKPVCPAIAWCTNFSHFFTDFLLWYTRCSLSSFRPPNMALSQLLLTSILSVYIIIRGWANLGIVASPLLSFSALLLASLFKRFCVSFFGSQTGPFFIFQSLGFPHRRTRLRDCGPVLLPLEKSLQALRASSQGAT